MTKAIFARYNSGVATVFLLSPWQEPELTMDTPPTEPIPAISSDIRISHGVGHFNQESLQNLWIGP